jgi:23S rRNA pseudouridine2605 synthase
VKERIQKILGNAGVASRRNVEEMIRQGRVAVNGKIVTELPILIDPRKDKIAVDDEPLKLASSKEAPRIYILMNKPRGVYSTNVAQGEQTRAIDLLPPELPGRVYPVGRLDAESKGLLLLTNDGDLTNKLTHPRYGVSKTYRAMVDGFVTPEVVQELAQGIWLADPKTGKGFKTTRALVKIVNRTRLKSVLELTMKEGRNTQIRRVLAKLGHKVHDLTRVRLGPLTLHGLAAGEFRSLTPRELKALQKMGEEKGNPKSKIQTKPEARNPTRGNPKSETRNPNQ